MACARGTLPALACLANAAISAQSIPSPAALQAQVDRQLPALTTIYRDLHRHPELSHHEEKTSALMAAELRKAGYEVQERIGRHPDGSKGWASLEW